MDLLAELDPAVQARLLARARTWVAAPGEVIFPPTASWRRAAVVAEGLARGYLAATSGRQMTVRYIRAGELIGSVFPLAGDRAPMGVEALTECRVVELDAADLLEIVATDAHTATLVLQAFSRRLEDLYATLAASAFGTMRERVAGHLLELAHAGDDGRLCAAVTQQQLADNVGTSREVVARVLADLREAGVVATTTGSIDILDAARLAASVGRWRLIDAR